MVKDATGDYFEEMMQAALEINLPNYANAIVTTNEALESISFSQRGSSKTPIVFAIEAS